MKTLSPKDPSGILKSGHDGANCQREGYQTLATSNALLTSHVFRFSKSYPNFQASELAVPGRLNLGEPFEHAEGSQSVSSVSESTCPRLWSCNRQVAS